MSVRNFLSVLVALGVAGCSALPAPGPTAAAILDPNAPNGPKKPYVVIEMDEKVTNVTGQYRPPAFSSFFRIDGNAPSIRLSKGDTLNVNIFEAGADGLFSSATAKATQISAQIDESGMVFVPYVGALQAEGRSPQALRETIQRALEDKAIQPQVQVAVAQSPANTVTVLGDVGTPGPQPVTVAGTRILDLIALAGGSKGPTYETQVVLRRGRQVATAELEALFDNPQDNVPIRPGDTILVVDKDRSFTVLGAAGQSQEVKFDARRVTLSEGLAKAGGIDPTVGNPKGVFVFRFEPAEIAKQLDERATTAPDGTKVPVIYRLNMRDPKSMFLATLFELRDEDILYVAESPTAQLSKFIAAISPLIQTGIAFAATADRVTD